MTADLVNLPVSIEARDWIEDRVCETGKTHDAVLNDLIDAWEARRSAETPGSES